MLRSFIQAWPVLEILIDGSPHYPNSCHRRGTRPGRMRLELPAAIRRWHHFWRAKKRPHSADHFWCGNISMPVPTISQMRRSGEASGTSSSTSGRRMIWQFYAPIFLILGLNQTCFLKKTRRFLIQILGGSPKIDATRITTPTKYRITRTGMASIFPNTEQKEKVGSSLLGFWSSTYLKEPLSKCTSTRLRGGASIA